ncbi:DXO-like protein [Mya arenaria]|uniref:Decapping nuclease n=1 Tax=Mya arenaria TaxID=6604 RepID=A0ABY7FID9_MYAAR|nr:DXO-like protein [Mya arenaria]
MAEGNTDISVSEPKKIGFFSLDINGVFLNNDSKKKTFIEPKRNSDGVLLKPLDLKKGTMTKKRDENKKPKLDNILQWIKLHGRDMQTDFVCKRSLLNKIMSTPYDAKKKLRIDVTLYKGIYYLCNRPKENKPEQTECREEEKWGYKFEQYLTEDMDYNSCEAFYNVMKVQVGSHILVYSCEVDAVSTDESGEHSVEFKTIKHSKLDAERIATFKRYKLLKWWSQSVLVQASEVVDTECSCESVSVQAPEVVDTECSCESVSVQASEVVDTECSCKSVSVQASEVVYTESSCESASVQAPEVVDTECSCKSISVQATEAVDTECSCKSVSIVSIVQPPDVVDTEFSRWCSQDYLWVSR